MIEFAKFNLYMHFLHEASEQICMRSTYCAISRFYHLRKNILLHFLNKYDLPDNVCLIISVAEILLILFKLILEICYY